MDVKAATIGYGQFLSEFLSEQSQFQFGLSVKRKASLPNRETDAVPVCHTFNIFWTVSKI